MSTENSESDQKIYVAGHRGMVGSSIVRELERRGSSKVITQTHSQLDLINQAAVRSFFEREKPNQVYLAAAKVGGIHANNTYPAEFIYENLMVEANVIHEAWRVGVKKLLFLGSSCIYPRVAPQPMSEEVLLSGSLEPTNEPYAIAKIAGIKLCESYNRQYGQNDGTDFRSVMPTNLYGPGDNYHPENSHVIPALIRRFHEAKMAEHTEVIVWGSGLPRREFLYVDDMATACIDVMNIEKKVYDKYTSPMRSFVNVGFGEDIEIRELAALVAKAVGYQGEVTFDPQMPDGSPQKLMNNAKLISMGWQPQISLKDGLDMAYEDFLTNHKQLRLN